MFQTFFGTLFRDLRQGARSIRKTPLLSAIAIGSVALGIAANVTVFSLTHSFLLRPLPYPEADQLVLLWERPIAQPEAFNLVAPATFFDWQERSNTLAEVAAYRFANRHLGGGERPEQLFTADITPSFLTTLGVEPLRGRLFTEAEGTEGEGAVAVLSEDLWRNSFAAREDLVGSELELDGETFTVVGILPRTFEFFQGSVDLWRAEQFLGEQFERGERNLLVVGRRKADITSETVVAELMGLSEELAKSFPESHEGWTSRAQTLRESFPGPTDTALLEILTTVLALVLLVACANVSSLLLARSQTRRKEMAVRLALGAGRSRLLRQLLTESVQMAFVGGLLGLFLGRLGISALAASLPAIIPSFYSPTMNPTVMAYGLGVAMLCGLAFGFSPALEALRSGTREALLEGGRGATADRRQKRLLRGFVVAELALALAILVGAALLTEVFDQRLGIEPGFDAENLLTSQLTLPAHLYPEDDDLRRFTEDLERNLDALPGTRGATLVTALPRTRALNSEEISFEGEVTEDVEARRTVRLGVGPDYFQTLGVSLRSGRLFQSSDGPNAPPVAVVNRRFVERYLEGEEAVGQRIEIAGATREIVGVVDNVAQRRLAGIQPPVTAVYLPLAQQPMRSMHLMVRTEGDPYALTGAVQERLAVLAPAQPLGAFTTIEEHVAHQLSAPLLIARILYSVGLLVLALAAMGIYGVMSFSVVRQTGEIGLRMALGALPRQILARVTLEGARMASIGFALGIPAALGIHRLVQGFFETSTQDFGGEIDTTLALLPMFEVAALLLGIGLLACYLPARHATRIDPAEALETR